VTAEIARPAETSRKTRLSNDRKNCTCFKLIGQLVVIDIRFIVYDSLWLWQYVDDSLQNKPSHSTEVIYQLRPVTFEQNAKWSQRRTLFWL